VLKFQKALILEIKVSIATIAADATTATMTTTTTP